MQWVYWLGEAASCLTNDVPGPLINPCTYVRRWTARRTMPVTVGRERGMAPIAEKGQEPTIGDCVTPQACDSSPPLGTTLRFLASGMGSQTCARAEGTCAWMRAAGRGYVMAQARSRLSDPIDPLYAASRTMPPHVICGGGPQSCRPTHRTARRKANSTPARMAAAGPLFTPTPSPLVRK